MHQDRESPPSESSAGRARVSRGQILLLLGTLLFLALLALGAEAAVRAFSDITFLGNSSHLFLANAYGTSNGNAPNTRAISFGADVYTDAHGFRVPRGGVPGDEGKAESILILGDSVAFGPGVAEEESLAGLLRARLPDKRILNASVIGYTTADYRNVVQAFVPLEPSVTDVVIVYCLNDVSAKSAEAIDRHLQAKQALQGFAPLRTVNDYLRSRSKFYLLIKQTLMAPQETNWKEVAQLYAPERAADLEAAARDLAEVRAFLEPRGIRLLVVLSPFEYQLRHPEEPAAQVPQQRLGELLSGMGVRAIDPRPAFSQGEGARGYFLPFDAMHFSTKGHQVMADVIARALQG